MPAVADFTLAEILAEMATLKAMGPKGQDPRVGAAVYDFLTPPAFHVTFDPYGSSYSGRNDDRRKISCAGEGQTWREAFAACRADYDRKIGDALRETTKRMALAIISSTVDTGSCTHAALRGSGFDQSEIDQCGADAVSLANTYADAGPFSLLATAGNGDPTEELAAAE